MFLVVVGKLTTTAFHCEKKEGGDLDATVKFGDALWAITRSLHSNMW